MSEKRAELERRLRDVATPEGVTQYVRGILDGLEYILELPATAARSEQRAAAADTETQKDIRAAGVWPTRLLRHRLPQFRSGGTK